MFIPYNFNFRPDLIQYDKLQKSNAMHNLDNAFTVAEDKLGLTRLLDPEGKFCVWVLDIDMEPTKMPK